MPIRPEQRALYPAHWPETSRRIRVERAEGRCECDGRCGTRHPDVRCRARQGDPLPPRWRVLLTVAHLDHDPRNCDEDNLRAMCQRCHLAYDAEHHAATRRATRFAELTAGMTPLFDLLLEETPDDPRPPG